MRRLWLLWLFSIVAACGGGTRAAVANHPKKKGSCHNHNNNGAANHHDAANDGAANHYNGAADNRRDHTGRRPRRSEQPTDLRMAGRVQQPVQRSQLGPVRRLCARRRNKRRFVRGL
jgi:hypothetical protein